MMTRYVLSLCTAAALAGATLSAHTTMDQKAEKAGKMEKAMRVTGCVERGSSGSYTLTHATMAEKKSSHKRSTDSTSSSTMDSEHAGMDETLSLMGSTVDFSKHVGHKVTVKGTHDGDGITVTSVKMLAKTCP